MFLIFVKKSGFIFRKPLILGGYGLNKYEKMCIGWRVCVQSGKRDWQERFVDESWGCDPFKGHGERVTATRGRMTSIVWETL